MLGDAIHTALSSIGITPERVSDWLGAPCRCKERQDKLNQLSVWAYRVSIGRVQNAQKYLEAIIGDA